MAEKDISARLRRAVKENNLFLVKRLLERTTDMRNADPGGTRYTSLAWAAVLGHEETFEYLLARGHDDDELSKDADNNTILIILSGLRVGVNSPYSSSRGPDPLQEAALRMARSYHERFPFILDWSNVQGKTALHMASLKGNEDFVAMLCDLNADIDLADLLGNTPLHYASSWGHLPAVKLLIEKGCQFAARNNEGYTATDYAYSHHTKETLEDSARAVYDARKNARRPPYVQLRTLSLDEDRPLPRRKEFKRPTARLRSGSATTTTSESADELAAQVNSQSSLSSITSSQTSGLSNGSVSLSVPSTQPSLRSPSQGAVNGIDSSRPGLPNSTSFGVTSMGHSVLSPVASRVLASDAGAMAEYLKRSRNSGSQGESSRHVIVQASSHHAPSTINTATPPIMEEPISQKYSLRRLRPSSSAAALRETASAASPTQTSPTAGNDIRSRLRAGTNPNFATGVRPQFSPSTPATGRLPSEEFLDRSQTPRRTATSGPTLPSLLEPATGLDNGIPPALPPKDHPPHRRGPSVS